MPWWVQRGEERPERCSTFLILGGKTKSEQADAGNPQLPDAPRGWLEVHGGAVRTA